MIFEWLTSEEAAQYLRIKRRTLLLWVRQGKIPAYPLSGCVRHAWRFRREDLDTVLMGPTMLPSRTSSTVSAERVIQ